MTAVTYRRPVSFSSLAATYGLSPPYKFSAIRVAAGSTSQTIGTDTLIPVVGRRVIPLIVRTNTANFDAYVEALLSGRYLPGNSDIRIYVSSNVLVGSVTTSTAALAVPSAFLASDTVSIDNSGSILGCGGRGGRGGYPQTTPATVGLVGGVALQLQRATTVTNRNVIGGGGGGGGGGNGGSTTVSPTKTTTYYGGGGGGGGAGYNGGAGGTAGTGGTPGGSGTPIAGGGLGAAEGGPAAPGGAGGGLGSPGVSSPNGSGGVAGGVAVNGVSNITWVLQGTLYGGTA